MEDNPIIVILDPAEFHELLSEYQNYVEWTHKDMDERQRALAARVLEKLRKADATHVCVDEMQEGGWTTLTSLDWSKKYEVLSISRLDLHSYGLTTEQINQLSDADMECIAEELYHRYDLNNFGEDVVFVARLVLAEKE